MKQAAQYTYSIAILCIALIISLPIDLAYALSITDIEISKIGSSTATIKWKTDEVASGKVKYGTTVQLPYTQRHSTYVYDHEIPLSALTPETAYYVEIESTNLDGDTLTKNNNGHYYTFKTKDITPPEKIAGLTIVSYDKTNIGLSWTKSNAIDISHYNIYRDHIRIANSTLFSYLDMNVTPGSTFSYKVSAVDISGNEGLQSENLIAQTLALDFDAPTISNVYVADVTDTAATINWNTNENAVSFLYYGLGDSLALKTASSIYKTNHSLTMSGLTRGNIYSFMPQSCDKENNCFNGTKQAVQAGIDVKPPYLNVSLPRYLNRNAIDISGIVEPSSRVKLFINDMTFPKRALDSTETGNGRFEFQDVILQKENVIKVTALDLFNNINETTMRVSVDTEDPTVVISDLPALTAKNNVTIVGTVDELVTINFYLRFGSNEAPFPVVNLRVNESNTSVLLKWNRSNETDFSHYIVYREDVGALALANQQFTPEFRDTKVKKDSEYRYWITVMDKFGKEGPISNTATAHITSGTINVTKPQAVDSIVLEKPAANVTTDGSFRQSFLLSNNDGVYSLLIEVLDQANNRVLIEKTITLDTKKPDIEITNPPTGTLIYENYANEIDITGKTEPGARVHLYVHRTPFGQINTSAGISGIGNTLDSLPETQLEANCQLALRSLGSCREAADYSVTADSNGRFTIENVDVTRFLGIAMQLEEVDPATLYYNRDIQLDKTAKLIFVVTDKTGLRNMKEHALRLGTCWTGNQTWSITPLTQYQSPTFISPQRLADNKEIINFYLKYDYLGQGQSPKVKSVSIQRACSGTEVLKDPRFNISCKLMPSGGTSIVNNAGDHSYTSIPLNRLPNMDRYLGDDWGAFYKAMSNELVFPMKVIISFEYTDNGETKKETQTTCQEVAFVMDNALIDPRKVLPDWLLYDFVDFLQNSVKSLNDVNKALTQVLEVVVIGCVSSFVLRLVMQTIRRFDTFYAEKEFALKNGFEIAKAIGGAKSEDQDYCQKVVVNAMRANSIVGKDAKQDSFSPKEWAKFKLKYLSDADLLKCFPKVYASWTQEAQFYKYYRYTCDRVFGHKTPSRWTEALDDKALQQKIESGQSCENDESVRGKALMVASCEQAAKDMGISGNALYSVKYEAGDKCVKVSGPSTVNKGGTNTGLYKIGDNLGGNVYAATQIKALNSIETIHIIKKTDTQFLTNQDQTCAQVCGITKSASIVSAQQDSAIGSRFPVSATQLKPAEAAKPGVAKPKPQWDCRTVQTCVNLNNPKDKGAKMDAINKGYTSDCFYGANPPFDTDPKDALKRPDSVSDNRASRYECCCINANPQPSDVYYMYSDLNKYETPREKDSAAVGRQPAFQAKSGTTEPQSWQELKWSYRYWKEGYETVGKDKKTQVTPATVPEKRDCDDNVNCLAELEKINTKETVTTHSKYNPNRYIEGRDYAACFGQNNFFYETGAQLGGTDEGQLLIIDSRQQHTSAFICANVGGVQNRIKLLTNIMSALSTCLVDIREKGSSDSAACKEIFTRYVCSTLWELIHLMANSCSPWSVESAVGDEDEISAFVKGGVGSVYQSIGDSAKELGEEYNNVALNNLIGAGGSEIARKVCLAAFGYDWDLNMNTLLDAAYAQTMATLVQAITGTREYLSVDPGSSKARYEYRASWMINPGCNIENYKVQLSCVTQNELLKKKDIRCDRVSSPDGANCDCLNTNANAEKLETFYSSAKLAKQNVLVQGAHNLIVNSFYRYDHLKFTIIPDRRLKEGERKTCFPVGHEDGVFYFPINDKTARDIRDCVLNAGTGTFDCTGGIQFFNREGFASFIDVRVNGKQPVNSVVDVLVNEPLTFSAEVMKSTGSPLKCMQIAMDRPGYTTTSQIEEITLDGVNVYGPYTLEQNIRFTAGTTSLTTGVAGVLGCTLQDATKQCTYNSKEMRYDIVSNTNLAQASFIIEFIDDASDGIIIEGNSPDTIRVNGVSETIARVRSNNNGQLLVISNAVSIRINSAVNDKTVKTASYNVNVGGSTTGSATWKLSASLHEIPNNGTNCMVLNRASEPLKYQGTVQKRDITIRVVQDSKSVGRGGPDIIKLNEVVAPEISLNEFIYDLEVKDDKSVDKIQYSIKESSRIAKSGSISELGCGVSKQKDISCQLRMYKGDNNGSISKLGAGTYELIIEAYDNENNLGTKSVAFKII